MFWMYGGAFNPPTVAHENIMNQVKKHIGKDTLVVVPVGDDYHKASLVSIHHRINMLACLKKDVMISDIESLFKYEGTLKTLSRLETYYDQSFGFVVGSDQLETIQNWIQVETLLKKHPMIIITRPGFDIQSYEEILKTYQATYHLIPLNMDVASHRIRQDVKTYQKDLAPCVYNYIQTHRLYEG